MVNLTIDGISVSVEEGATIYQAAKQAGKKIPTLCNLEGVSHIGGCRVCVVEVEGEDRMCASCNVPVAEGMVVRTNTPAVIEARQRNVELLLSEHNTACTSCLRTDTCALRRVAADLNVNAPLFVEEPPLSFWDETFPLQRDATKCIKCMRCLAVCEKVQHCAVWDFTGSGPRWKVTVKDGLDIKDAGCALCGQCITHCPTGALTARDDTAKVVAALKDPNVMTVIQVAPAVRSSWGEGIGLARELATPKRMAAAMRALGFDYVYDTDWAADLTIMEEGSELIEYIKEGKKRPMFTSCCPGWVRFAKLHYPQFVPQLSTSKSPHQMQGACIKHVHAAEAEENGQSIFVLSLMPCVAKKYECDVPELATDAGRDVDAVLTIREFDNMLRMFSIDCENLEETPFDDPLGQSTGAATIFGRTGGVMEAALRTAAKLLTGEEIDYNAVSWADATPEKPWIVKNYTLAGLDLSIAVASGLENTSKLLDALDAGEVQYDFVEIMACPGGCVNGGGQPIEFNCNQELYKIRTQVLNDLDGADVLRRSHENPSIIKFYEDWAEKPLSETAEAWLHTEQGEWQI